MTKSSTKPKSATSYKHTAFGIISRSKLLPLELEGTKRGLEYIHDLNKHRKHIPITPEFINKLHDVAFGWIFPEWAGKFRTIQVTYSGKEAPPYYMIPELILNLCNDLQTRENQISPPDTSSFATELTQHLAWFQHRFVYIHPFQDYNGRIARMLTIHILLAFNLPPIEIQAETNADRKRYIKALQQADNGNYSLLEQLISTELTMAFEKYSS